MSESKHVLLARLVHQAWERDDAVAMRLFGTNTTLMLASDVEREEGSPPDLQHGPRREPCVCPGCPATVPMCWVTPMCRPCASEDFEHGEREGSPPGLPKGSIHQSWCAVPNAHFADDKHCTCGLAEAVNAPPVLPDPWCDDCRGYTHSNDCPSKQHPCRECGVLRTKAEGGTTFSVCDECWDRVHNHKFLRHQARPSWDCCMYQTEPGGLACRRPASAHAVQPE